MSKGFSDLDKARAAWRFRGQKRPDFAIEPGPGQESVWDYPRPPCIDTEPREVVIRLGEREIARSSNALRVLETASPPTVYLPPQDVKLELLEHCSGRSFCEWKGAAQYWALVCDGKRIEQAAWSYPEPFEAFSEIKDYLAFYPSKVACFVDEQRVQPQPGIFYGGWITPELVGPFKGEPGSEHW